MKCTRCNIENDAARKYCKSCGAPMGVVCNRCGVVNEYEDKYCGVCGFAFVQSANQESRFPASEGAPPSLGSGQYSARDIEELMTLRAKMKKEEDLTESLRQGDIDELFG